jgi:hypothetical protein
LGLNLGLLIVDLFSFGFGVEVEGVGRTRMDYARIGFGPRMNRVDRGSRMGRLPRLGGGLRGVGTCWMGLGDR